MNKNKNRIGKELIFVLLILFSLIVILLLAASYLVHSREIDNLFKERVEQLSVSVSSLLNGDYLENLSNCVSSDEFQELREKANEEGLPELLEDYLKEAGLYSERFRKTQRSNISMSRMWERKTPCIFWIRARRSCPWAFMRKTRMSSIT